MRLLPVVCAGLLMLLALPRPCAAEPSSECVAAARAWIMSGRSPDAFVASDGLSAETCAGAVSAAYRQIHSEADARAAAAREATERQDQISAARSAELSKQLLARWQAEAVAERKRKAAQAAQAKLPDPVIGMTADQVASGTNWGLPTALTRRTTTSGTTEVRRYGPQRQLVFENGKVVSIEASY